MSSAHRMVSVLARLAAALTAAALPATALGIGEPAPGAATPQTLAVPSGPGSLRGLADDATVTGFTGQVSYSVPIDLPDGPGGFTPALSIDYAGELGNGPLGIGWRLTMPSLRRDTRRGVPRYDASDELVAVGVGPGGRLIPDGTGALRPLGAPRQLVVEPSGAGFVARDASGNVYTLGTTPGARLADGDRIAAWYVETVRNVAGETVDYRYATVDGQVELVAIEWGPRVGEARQLRASFDYSWRPDAVVDYRTGFRVVAGRRLAAIYVEAFGGRYRTVHFHYDDAFPLTRLAGITVTGGHGDDEVSLPSLRFDYAPAADTARYELGGLGDWALNERGVSLFDIDRDGAADLLRLDPGGHSYRRNLGGAYGPAIPLPGAAGAALTGSRLLDLTGDAVGELVRQVGTSWQVDALERGDDGAWRWRSLGAWPGTHGLSLDGGAFADVNGDGRVDRLAPLGTQYTSVHWGGDAGIASARVAPLIDRYRRYIAPGNAATSFPDLNGDGLADVAYLGATAIYTYLGRGDGTFERFSGVAYPWTGSVDRSQIRLGDLDRDGIADLARIDAGAVRWYRGKPDGSYGLPVAFPSPPAFGLQGVVALADARGNGSLDVVWSFADGCWVIDMAGATHAGMLAAIDNGLGQSQRFAYASSSRLAWDDERRGAPWQRQLPIAIPVAIESRLAIAGEPDRVTSLAVRDGVYDGARRELVGFASVRVTRLGDAPEAALVTETEHELGLGDDRALRGLARQTQVYDGAGALLRKTRYQRATVPFAAAPDQPALATPVLLAVDERDSAGGAARETRVRYAYDALGREIEEARDGRLDLDGDESVVRRTYAEAGPQGVLDRVCEERRFTGDGELEAHTQTLFGTADAVLPACEAGPGWVCEVRQRALETDTWVTTSATRYDAHGNAIAITEGGVTRSLGYDPSGSFPVTESVSPAPGTTLTWTATWNPVLGVVEALAGPSGETTRVRHDGLGRVVSIASGDRAPHLRYAYRWDEPTPHTVTYTFDGALDDVVPLPEPGAARPGWREAIAVFNGAGELRYHAVRLDAARWVIGDYQRRDARGRVVEVAEGFYAESAFAAAPGPDVATQTLRYDALDRVVEQALATGATKRVEYAPFRRTATTAGLAPVTTELDGQGRAVRVQRSIDGALERVEARYDAAGRVRAFGLQGGAVSHRFDYDSLGRLVHASDPDLGERWLRYDADGRLVEHENGAGQIVRYDYDGAGRLVRVAADDGARFQYHYDAPRDAGFAFTVGRLAWVTEPTGIVELGYDELGRVARTRRDVDGRVADEHTGYAASGLVRETRYADGLALAIRYDGAARPIALAEVGARGELWRAEAVDAAGRIVSERFGNGISQAYTYDRLGQPSAVTLARGAQSLYGVAVTRNAWGGIERVDDVDGVGLDHAATYGYDGAARLTAATLGAAGAGYAFSYAYDGLQNMVARGATGPTAVGALTGTYCYGEPGAGPRQLTSVVAGACGAGATRASFAYDAAGREIASGARRSSYNGLDQLVRVDAVAGGTVEHAYGYDGLRVRTRAADGSVERWFSSSVSERGAVRAHDVRIGERLIARIELGGGPAPEGAPSAGAVKAAASGGLVMTLFALVWLALRSRREPRAWLRLTAATGALALAFGGCDTSGLGSLGRATEAVRTIVYAHTGIGAGPPLFTDDAGGVFAERRYEPFGVPIDELRHPLGDVASVGAVDFARAPTNGLNRLSDPDTGWSYHGARWMAPETARWLTPDPPVKAPAASFMSEPWALHPYQYVKQNPVLFWDPTGNYEELVHGALTYHLAVAAGFAQKDAAAIALNTQAVDENPGTAPVSLRNVVSGRTNRYHFNRDAAAAGFNAEVAKGKHMNLATLGLWLHGLEDHDAGGPHSGSSLGHPFRLTERGKVSTPFHHTNDQAWQNPKQYRRQLWQQYRYLKAAAIAKYGADNVTFDDDAALAAIDRVVGIRTRSSEMFFANTQIGDGPDGPLSYMDWRDKHADGTAGFRVNAKPWAGFGSSLANDIKPRNDPSWLDD